MVKPYSRSITTRNYQAGECCEIYKQQKQSAPPVVEEIQWTNLDASNKAHLMALAQKLAPKRKGQIHVKQQNKS